MEKRVSVQVQKIVSGATLYAWKLPGLTDPSEGSLSGVQKVVWTSSGDPDPVGYERWMMNTSLVGTKAGVGKGQWGVCATCQEEFPLTELTKIRGRWYCEKNRCKEDFE